MNSFMTSLSKNVKPHFISNPMDLLETKASILLDCREYVVSYEQSAGHLFQPVDQGVYLPWSTRPLFTPYEELYTHRDTHEYFPEISESVVNPIGFVMHAQRRGVMKPIAVRQTVGDRIDWRSAVEQQVNVYNSAGRLLIPATTNRNRMKLLFNPGPEIHAQRFMMDLVELLVLEATCWGDSNQVKIKMGEYIRNRIDVDFVVKQAVEMHSEFFKQIVDWVKQDPWAIYKVNTFGTSVMIDKSCDYRHFKCNEMLIEKLQEEEPDHNLLNTFKAGEKNFGPVRYEDLDGLFNALFNATGHRVDSVPELFELLGATKNNQAMTSQVLLVFEDYLSDKKNQSSLASELVGKLTSRSFINKVLEKQDGISSSDFNVGAGIYIL